MSDVDASHIDASDIDAIRGPGARSTRRPASARTPRRLSLMTSWIAPLRSGVSVLIYHQVGSGSAGPSDIGRDEFREQLRLLRDQHRVITLDEAVRGLSREDHAVDGCVVLTFDDGTADFADVVVPELIDLHMPATVYVATGFVEEQRPFGSGALPVSWQGLRDAIATDLVTVGSHTYSHRPLDRVSLADADDDIARSIDTIADRLGRTPVHFAYPQSTLGGREIDELVRGRFRTAALARSRLNLVGRTDLHRLWRTPVQRGDSIATFAHKVLGGTRWRAPPARTSPQDR